MPGQPLRDAAGRRDHEDVGVAVVSAAERDEAPVREKAGRIPPRVRGQPPDVLPVEVGRPEVVGIDESQALGRDGRLRQELRVRGVDGLKPSGSRRDDKTNPANTRRGISSWKPPCERRVRRMIRPSRPRGQRAARICQGNVNISAGSSPESTEWRQAQPDEVLPEQKRPCYNGQFLDRVPVPRRDIFSERFLHHGHHFRRAAARPASSRGRDGDAPADGPAEC